MTLHCIRNTHPIIRTLAGHTNLHQPKCYFAANHDGQMDKESTGNMNKEDQKRLDKPSVAYAKSRNRCELEVDGANEVS